MPQENLEIVRRLYESMNTRDAGGTAELLHPDAEWIPDSRVAEGPVRGRENIISFFADRGEMFHQLLSEIERSWEKDDTVLVFLRVAGSGEASGAGFEIRIGHLWTVRDGLVVRGQGFGDRDQALEAAGITE
jgi:ketosteroid isomerase-like protein